jgi:hypothetical protein
MMESITEGKREDTMADKAVFVATQKLNNRYRRMISAVLYVVIHDCELNSVLFDSGSGGHQKETEWRAQVEEFGFSEDFYRNHLFCQTPEHLFSEGSLKLGWKTYKDCEESIWILAYSLFIPWEERHDYRPQRKKPLFDLSKAKCSLNNYWASFIIAHQSSRPNPKEMVLLHFFDRTSGGSVTNCLEFYSTANELEIKKHRETKIEQKEEERRNTIK